jgi:hypothetical protein
MVFQERKFPGDREKKGAQSGSTKWGFPAPGDTAPTGRRKRRMRGIDSTAGKGKADRNMTGVGYRTLQVLSTPRPSLWCRHRLMHRGRFPLPSCGVNGRLLWHVLPGRACVVYVSVAAMVWVEPLWGRQTRRQKVGRGASSPERAY